MKLRIAVADFALLSLFLSASACGPGPELVEGDDLLVLEGGTVVDGTGAPPRPSAVVVVDGGRILRVGRVGDLRYPGDAEIVDLTGRWLVPGFMDLHAYLPDPESRDEVLRTLLEFGITTFRNPGGDSPELGTELRDRIAAGEILGPRMFTAGRFLDAPGGKPGAVEVATEPEVRAGCRKFVTI